MASYETNSDTFDRIFLMCQLEGRTISEKRKKTKARVYISTYSTGNISYYRRLITTTEFEQSKATKCIDNKNTQIHHATAARTNQPTMAQQLITYQVNEYAQP
jgi:hypothetical protein